MRCQTLTLDAYKSFKSHKNVEYYCIVQVHNVQCDIWKIPHVHSSLLCDTAIDTQDTIKWSVILCVAQVHRYNGCNPGNHGSSRPTSSQPSDSGCRLSLCQPTHILHQTQASVIFTWHLQHLLFQTNTCNWNCKWCNKNYMSLCSYNVSR